MIWWLRSVRNSLHSSLRWRADCFQSMERWSRPGTYSRSASNSEPSPCCVLALDADQGVAASRTWRRRPHRPRHSAPPAAAAARRFEPLLLRPGPSGPRQRSHSRSTLAGAAPQRRQREFEPRACCPARAWRRGRPGVAQQRVDIAAGLRAAPPQRRRAGEQIDPQQHRCRRHRAAAAGRPRASSAPAGHRHQRVDPQRQRRPAPR